MSAQSNVRLALRYVSCKCAMKLSSDDKLSLSAKSNMFQLQ